MLTQLALWLCPQGDNLDSSSGWAVGPDGLVTAGDAALGVSMGGVPNLYPILSASWTKGVGHFKPRVC